MTYYQYFIVDNDDSGECWEIAGLADYSNLYKSEEECRKSSTRTS